MHRYMYQFCYIFFSNFEKFKVKPELPLKFKVKPELPLKKTQTVED